MTKQRKNANLTDPKAADDREYKLESPLTEGGEAIDTLYFRKPNVGDLKALEHASKQGSTAADVKLIERLTGILPITANKISIDDLAGIEESFISFFTSRTLDTIETKKAEAMASYAIASNMSQ